MPLADRTVLSFLHLLTVVSCIQHAPTPEVCKDIVPGLQKLVEGVDITKLDLFPLSDVSDNGFKKAVIDFTCGNGAKKNIDDTTYDLPDQVESVNPQTRGLQIYETHITESESQIMKTLSVNAGIKPGTEFAAFSASSTYRKMQDDIAEKKLYISQAYAECETFVMKLKPHLALTLGASAQQHLDQLPPTFDDNPSAYLKFIEMFGTHYFSQGKLGGVMVVTLKTNSSGFETLSDKMFKVNVDAVLKALFPTKAGVAFEAGKNSKTAKLEEASMIITKYYGGQHGLASKDIEEWQKTIGKAPYFISGLLKPISDLISDKRKKTAMKTATKYHLFLAKMLDLDKLTHIRRKTWTQGENQLIVEQKKLDGLKEMKTLKTLTSQQLNDSLEEIENQVRVPEWFTDKVTFCLRYVARGDKAQCNGKDEDQICAETNRMTQPYLDMTDTRDGGCGMYWSLSKSDAPKSSETWLSSTQIVFRWYSVWSPCACGGRDGKDGVPFILSAAPNKWTQEFFDDTSEKHGECIMQWMLKVPDSAPVWAKNIKLCYHMSCGQIKGCVLPNNWTQPYTDISSSTSSCAMSWGIQIY